MIQTRWTLLSALLLTSVSALSMGCASGAEEEGVATSADSIVGGVLERGYAAVVAIGDSSGPFCSGTVVSRRVVVSAAHCAGGVTRVFFGANAYRPDRTLRVAREIPHPRYNEFSMTNDLLVIELAEDAPVAPMPLYRGSIANTSEFVGPDLTFVGYGMSNGRTGAGFGQKRSVQFPINKVGPATVGGTAGRIDATQFYYRLSGANTCGGDSGGPSFLNVGGKEFLVGVTSYGDQDCVYDGVNQRTDAPQIASFIQREIDRIEGTYACKADNRCGANCTVSGLQMDPDCP
ncbi:MAG: trypsin-like serine protease [Polyangiaceae bacterium]|nr:trypsin-like serine protease [Polyangiaceae bacterium]